MPQKKQPSKVLKDVCKLFEKHGYGTAGFTIGDGLAGKVSVTFTHYGITGFIGGGLGAGTSFKVGGGLHAGVSTDASWGFDTFASATAALGPVGGTTSFTGGTDGVDGSAGLASGGGLSAVAGIGIHFTIVHGNPASICP